MLERNIILKRTTVLSLMMLKVQIMLLLNTKNVQLSGMISNLYNVLTQQINNQTSTNLLQNAAKMMYSEQKIKILKWGSGYLYFQLLIIFRLGTSIILFDLILYVPVNNFSNTSG